MIYPTDRLEISSLLVYHHAHYIQFWFSIKIRDFFFISSRYFFSWRHLNRSTTRMLSSNLGHPMLARRKVVNGVFLSTESAAEDAQKTAKAVKWRIGMPIIFQSYPSSLPLLLIHSPPSFMRAHRPCLSGHASQSPGLVIGPHYLRYPRPGAGEE